VRLEAVRALARIPDRGAAEVALRVLDKPMDRFLDYALWLTARELAPQWLPALPLARFNVGGNARHLVFALQAVDTPAVVGPLLEVLRAGRVPDALEEGVLMTIATQGAPDDLAVVFDLALTQRDTALLEALMKATSERKVRPTGDLARLGAWLDSPDEAVSSAAARAAGLWKVEPLRGRLTTLAAGAIPSTVRRAAIEGLARYGDRAARDVLEGVAGRDLPTGAEPWAIVALAGLDVRSAAVRAVAWLAERRIAEALDDEAVVAVVARFAQLQGGPPALIAALKGKSLPRDVAKVAIRAVRSTGREFPLLIEALSRAASLQEPAAPPSPEQTAALAARGLSEGDPERGEAVFRRKESLCLKCHAIAGAGGQVGPGLESIGASAPADYLVDSLLQPGKGVKEGYHAITVALDDGRVLTGIKLRETGTAVVLRDADDREVSVPLASIDEQKPAGSLMPAGLTETMTESELLDLVRFLSELGKIGPYAVTKARLMRRWQVLEMTPEAIQALRRTSLDATIAAPSLTWSPAYSMVSGILPLETIPASAPATNQFFDIPGVSIARGQVDVWTGGAIQLESNGIEGLTLWVDGTRVPVHEETTLTLASGVHTLTLAIDRSKRRAALKMTLEDVAGSPAQAEVVLGK
jgi:putative heme-binding domain-containing protein